MGGGSSKPNGLDDPGGIPATPKKGGSKNSFGSGDRSTGGKSRTTKEDNSAFEKQKSNVSAIRRGFSPTRDKKLYQSTSSMSNRSQRSRERSQLTTSERGIR